MPLLSVWPFIGTDLLGESSKRFLSALDLGAPLAMFGIGFDFESPGRFADFRGRTLFGLPGIWEAVRTEKLSEDLSLFSGDPR